MFLKRIKITTEIFGPSLALCKIKRDTSALAKRIEVLKLLILVRVQTGCDVKVRQEKTA